MKNRQRGFSLIEIMVVVVILGILAALVVPKLMGRPDDARLIKAKQDVLTIQNALELYRLDNGIYPSTEQGLKALVQQPQTEPMPHDWRSYLKSVPKDPWGHPYLYLNPGQHGEIDVFTYGPQGESTDATHTIGNWDEN